MDHRDSPLWDFPLRLFHWLLVVLVVVSVVSVQIGGNAMEVHELSGLCILTLVLFRLIWGFVGGTHARFVNFVRGPGAILRYVRLLRAGHGHDASGHNPLGAVSVLAMLASLALQAGTGLFANDDIMMEGPLAKWVSKDTSDFITHVHHINANVLLALIALHLAAVAFYLWIKKDDILRPMITGRKAGQAVGSDAFPARTWMPRALLVMALCAAVVYALIR